MWFVKIFVDLKHISDKRKWWRKKQMDCHADLKFKVNVLLFIKWNNDLTEYKKKYFGIVSCKVLLFGNITLIRFSSSIFFSKWNISILVINKMRINFEDPVSRSIMLFATDFAKFWIYDIVCRTRIAAKMAILKYWYCKSFLVEAA